MLPKYLSILILLVMVIGGLGIGVSQIPTALAATSQSYDLHNYTVVETGLPSGYIMNVVITSMYGQYQNIVVSTGGFTSLNFMLQNGSYSAQITALAADVKNPYPYFPSIPFTTFVIDGGNFVTSEVFVHGYWLTFVPLGLPSAQGYRVTNSNHQLLTYGSGNQSSGFKNGAIFSYIITSPGYTAFPSSGNVTIAGSNVTLRVQFMKNISIGPIEFVSVYHWIQLNWKTTVGIGIAFVLFGWLATVALPSRDDIKKKLKKSKLKKSESRSTRRLRRPKKK